MARINNYIKDDIVEPTDIVIGTEKSTGKTKNYSIDSIRNFFVTETNVGGVIFKKGNHLVSGEFTANSNYFSGVTEFKFNKTNTQGDSVIPIFNTLKTNLVNNRFTINVEDSTNQNRFILAKILNIIDNDTFFTITLDIVKNVGNGELVTGNNFSIEVGLYTEAIDGTKITTVTSNKVGNVTTVTVNGDFDNAPLIFEILDGDATSGLDWSNLLNIPISFPPSAHTHQISDVTSLQSNLDGKVGKNANIVAGTKTKITYDVKGLVTNGEDATTADIADSLNKRYVSDAEKTDITHSNRSALDLVSGTNTGDNAVNSLYSSLVSNATHTGDVTGATALTIATDAVTNTKLANMVVNTIKGRITTGTGDPEDLTATQVRTIINVADGANNYIHPASHTISEVTGLQTALDGKEPANANIQAHITSPHIQQSDVNTAETNAKSYADILITQIINGAPADANTLKELNDKILAVQAIIGGTTADGDTIVNTVAELLAVFSTYTEGVDLVTLLAGKVNTTDVYNALDCIVAGKTLDARQGKALKDLIDTLTIVVSGKEPANANIQAHISSTSNPHGVTKAQVGLDQVDNTSDANKPVSNAQATADATVLADSKTYADGLITQLIDGAPADGNTLKELNDKILAVQAIIGGTTADGNTIVNTVAELLAVFSTYTEGVDLVTLLAGKVNTTDIYNALDSIVAGKVLDAQQGKVLKDLIDTLTIVVNNKQDALGFTPENEANKSQDIETDKASTIKYPSVKAFYDWVVAKFQRKLVAGTNITIDNTDPNAPIISAAGGTADPSQITITTAVSITTDTLGNAGKTQKEKNVIIDNGVNAINITVNGGADFLASYLKHGTGAITFVQGAGRTLIKVDGTAVLDGAVGSTATISSVGTIDYLRISNV